MSGYCSRGVVSLSEAMMKYGHIELVTNLYGEAISKGPPSEASVELTKLYTEAAKLGLLVSPKEAGS